MPFTIVRNDITKMHVDAIVNTANPRPVIGAGTDAAIHQAAGPGLLAARRKIGELRPGECAATRGFALPTKYVLHAVSPVWQDGEHGEAALLRRAYDAALEQAQNRRCRSVAFPLMAAGSYGFPEDLALSTAIRAFTDFLLEHEMQIYLVLFNGEAFDLSCGLFDDLKSYIDDNYVAGHTAQSAGSADRRRREYELLNAAFCEEADDSASFDLTPASRPKARKAARSETAMPGSLRDYLDQRENTFTEHLLDLLKEKGEKDSTVYHRAQMSRQLFNKIINKRDYQPTKNTAIQLAIGLRLDLPQTQRLLGKAGYALSRSSKSDLVVQYFIQHGEYSIVAINTALYDCDLPLLTK